MRFMESSPSQLPVDKRDRLLASLQARGTMSGQEIVYGIYDNSQASFWTQLEDWYIDRQRVPLREKSYVFHMLAVLVDGGIPLMQSLQILARGTSNQRFARILFTLAHDLSRGGNFSDAMARFPEVFDEFEVGVIRSGEAVGHLEDVLLRLSRELEDSYELSLKLWTASFYPIIVLIVLVLVGTGMVFFLMPNMLQLLLESGVKSEDLPFATRLLLGFKDFIGSFWWIVVFLIVALVTGFRLYIQSDDGRFQWDYWKLRFPLVGELIRKVIVLKFVRLLSLLLESGFPVVSSLKIIALALPNEVYRLKLWSVLSKVQDGQKISSCLKDAPFLFPEAVVQMLAIGEQSAAIAQTAEKVSSQYEKEISHTIKRLTATFEPIMIIFVGVFVALLALAILMPIFSLVGSISS